MPGSEASQVKQSGVLGYGKSSSVASAMVCLMAENVASKSSNQCHGTAGIISCQWVQNGGGFFMKDW